MSLKRKLFLLLLAPIVVLCGIHILELERITSEFERALADHKAQRTALLTQNLENAITTLERMTINLSHPKEIVRAIQTADNEVLFDWSHSFTKGVGSIVFTNAHGMVLSRAPDEFRFGDVVAGSPWFAQTLHHGAFLGVDLVDGTPSLIAARCIRKYDDIPVGTVCVAVPVTAAWLAGFVDDRQILRMQAAGRTVASAALPAGPFGFETLHVTPKGFTGPDAFAVGYLPDRQYQELVALEENIVVSGIVTAGLTILALGILLQHQLRPYGEVVDSLRAYSRDKVSLAALRQRLLRLAPRRSRELRNILDALIRMIDTLQHTFDRIAGYTSQLETLANTDPLTGLHNRKAINEILAAAKDRFDRENQPFALLMLDIDHFKAVNDTYGHQTGDAVLVAVADILLRHSRRQDAVARWGGEEFLVVCHDTEQQDARALAERLRTAVFGGSYPLPREITVSIGVVQMEAGDSIDSLISRADTALYAAKHAGRNTVRHA